MSNLQILFEHIDHIEELQFEPLEPKYIRVQFINSLIILLILLLIPLLSLLFTDEYKYQDIIITTIECLIVLTGAFYLWLIPKAYTYKGFAIREHDITYRSGIFFHSVVTIPFCKIQQVSIQQNLITRLFGLYSIDVVNGAQLLSGTRIPGLSEKTANRIKTLLTERIKDEK